MKTILSDKAVARLKFFNDDDAEIQVPKEVEVFNITNADAPDKLNPSPDYALGWTDNYRILYEGIVVVEYVNQRQWARRKPKTKASIVQGNDAVNNERDEESETLAVNSERDEESETPAVNSEYDEESENPAEGDVSVNDSS